MKDSIKVLEMKKFKIAAALFALMFGLARCKSRSSGAKDQAQVATFNNDSLAKKVMQSFSLPYFDNIQFDSSELVFYRSSSYDTSLLIHIKNNFTSNLSFEFYNKVMQNTLVNLWMQ